eukprot:m.64411 g.64411  ORF g.64411 m.64411 type:complete len:112 (+) comp11485_c0_seq2:646-981(+)
MLKVFAKFVCVCMCVLLQMYHYGHLSPKSNEKRYAQCLDLLAASISEKCRKDETANSSGLIINTPTCTADVIVKAAKTFQCDFILVIDTERLLNQVNTNLKKENVGACVCM